MIIKRIITAVTTALSNRFDSARFDSIRFRSIRISPKRYHLILHRYLQIICCQSLSQTQTNKSNTHSQYDGGRIGLGGFISIQAATSAQPAIGNRIQSHPMFACCESMLLACRRITFDLIIVSSFSSDYIDIIGGLVCERFVFTLNVCWKCDMSDCGWGEIHSNGSIRNERIGIRSFFHRSPVPLLSLSPFCSFYIFSEKFRYTSHPRSYMMRKIEKIPNQIEKVMKENFMQSHWGMK